jgi:hypothetical protein
MADHSTPAAAGKEDDDEVGGDIVPTTHKLEFPKYAGIGDPLP